MTTFDPLLAPSFRVVRGGEPVPTGLIGAVVAIGNFDGVHRGHRAVIAAAAARARALGRPLAALTFEPHPRAVFAPHVPLFRLTPEPVKLAALERAGCDAAIVMTFDTALAATTATRFVDETLVARFRICRRGDRLRFPLRQRPLGLAGIPGPGRRAARLRRRHRGAAAPRRAAGVLQRHPRAARRRPAGARPTIFWAIPGSSSAR